MFQGVSCFPDGLVENIPCGTVLGALTRFYVFFFFFLRLAVVTLEQNSQINDTLLCFANTNKHFSVCITSEIKHISHFYSFHKVHEIIATYEILNIISFFNTF